MCIFAGAWAAPAASNSASASAQSASVAKAANPTAKVFAQHGVKLLRTTQLGQSASFDVSFDYDVQTGPNQHKLNLLCADLLQANGWNPFTLVARDDGIEIRVKGDRRSRRVDIETSPLE